MIPLTDEARALLGRVIRFLAVGGTSALLYSIASALLVEWRWLGPQAAGIVCYTLAIPLAFLAQRRFTFASKGAPGREFGAYAALQVVVLAVSTAFIAPFIGDSLMLNAVVFLIFGLSAAFVSFVICQTLIFRPARGG